MRWGAVVDSRRTVLYAAALAFLLRLPGLSRPVRPDEAGWFLVARTWHPSENSVYGEHFVDRPPEPDRPRRPDRPARRCRHAPADRSAGRRGDGRAGRQDRHDRRRRGGRPLERRRRRGAHDQPADRPGRGEGRAAGAAAAGAGDVVGAHGDRLDVHPTRRRTCLRGRPRRRGGSRAEAEPRRRSGLRARAVPRLVVVGIDQPAPVRRAGREPGRGSRRTRARDDRLGPDRRGQALRALVHRLRLPLRRRTW